MDTFEDRGKNLEVYSLVDCKPVKVFVVLREMRTRVEVEHCSKSKVLYSLKFLLV